MSRAGHIPMRMCVVCARRAPKHALVRMVVADGRIVVDARQRMPGRGAYVCAKPECIRRLTPKRHGRIFRRALGKRAWEGLDERLMAVVAGE